MIKDVEVKISEFPDHEIIEQLETLIECKAIKGYHSDQYVEKMEPQIEEMKKKLEEIRIFILGY